MSGDTVSSPKPPLAHPHPHPLPRLKSRNRTVGTSKAEPVSLVSLPATSGSLECGPLSSSSSDSEDTGSSELDSGSVEADQVEDEDQETILSDLVGSDLDLENVGKTEPVASTSSAASKLEQMPVNLTSEDVPCQERSINTALEDELMLLRLLDLHGARSSSER